ncbi:MAG: biotin--[acetyl-CoA-carboxylase] ligase [Myxococcales bacterium]|nr:biotin--[acetyl-CoA-carboxylase] ligase [Myxococcales bacterium]
MVLADDRLEDLAGLLTTARLGRVHEHLRELGSTNDRALAWLSDPQAPAPDGALVSADAQTAGRGRLGRHWSSPPGRDLYASLILRPGAPQAVYGALALAVGVGLREGLLRAFDGALPGLSLKWPNDLLLDGRKLAGILCEARGVPEDWVAVVGIGLNVHRSEDEFEGPLRDTATSLARALPEARRRGRAAILAAILAALEIELERFFAGGFAAIRPRYEPHCLVLGRAVEVEAPGGDRVAATALGLDDDGALRVRDRSGREFRVESADVWMV